MNYFICGICGYISIESAPEKCPVCTAPKEKFTQNNSIFEESRAKAAEGAGKHVPVVTVQSETTIYDGADFLTVSTKIGQIQHPMEEKHFIQFIDIYADNIWVKRAQMTPLVIAAASAHLKVKPKKITVIENCNLHGYWISETSL